MEANDCFAAAIGKPKVLHMNGTLEVTVSSG